jgi:hypothetical protein
MNVETGGPAEGCTALLFRVGVAGRRQARMDGKRRTPVLPAFAAGEGAEPPSRKRINRLSIAD